MTRTRWILLGVIVAELVVGGVFAWRRLTEAVSPRPDLSAFDPITANELRAADTPEAWARLGELFLAHGYFPEAEACLREEARRTGDVDAIFRHGFALERLGRLSDAETRYREAIDKGHPRAADLWHYAARTRLRREDEGAAEGLAACGDLPAARYDLGRLHLRAGRLDEAEREGRWLVERHPAALQSVSLLYRVAVTRGDRAEAARLADRFGRQSAQLPMPFDAEFRRLNEAHDGFGLAGRRRELERAVSSGKLSEVEKLAQEVLAAGWTPAVADQWAEVAFQQGQPRDAAARLEEAIARDGPAWQFLERLGDAHQESGNADKALTTWQRAATIGTGPDVKNLRHKLATAYEKAGRRDTANAYHALAALAAGIEAFDAARPADAVVAFTEATRLDPRLAHAWFWLGECQRLSGRPAEARTAYEKCLQADPDHGRALRAVRLFSP